MKESSSSKQPSQVPSHIRPFFRSALTTNPEVKYRSSSSPLSSASTSPSATQSPEGDQRHCRLVSKRSLSETLRDILLKDWHGTHRNAHAALKPSRQRRPTRPHAMRMKDSDDYLTARAANPRTGLISPSIGTSSPTSLHTPDTPGEALKIVEDKQQVSPTPDATIRPPLKRANQGRKFNPKGPSQKWRADERVWVIENDAAVASPRVTCIKADAVPSRSHANLDADRFVVRMPSALEPQPYAYPGYSSRQIEAFEHYKRKAMISSQGYDRRLLQTAVCQASAGAQDSCGSGDSDTLSTCPRRTEPDGTFHIKNQNQVVRNKDDSANSQPPMCNTDDAALFAPFTSPRTPVTKSLGSSTAMRTFTQEDTHHIHRKPIRRAVEGELWNKTPTADIQNFDHHGQGINLSHLPRIALVHPSLASVPRPRKLRIDTDNGNEGVRSCSLGCQRHPIEGGCVERRMVPNHNIALFDTSRTPSSSTETAEYSNIGNQGDSTLFLPRVLELLLTAVIGASTACRRARFPRLHLVDTLCSEHATPQQKAQALRIALSSMGRLMAGLMIVAMLWQVGSIVVQTLEVLFWPFMVPLRVLRWLAHAG